MVVNVVLNDMLNVKLLISLTCKNHKNTKVVNQFLLHLFTKKRLYTIHPKLSTLRPKPQTCQLKAGLKMSPSLSFNPTPETQKPARLKVWDQNISIQCLSPTP